MIIKLHECNFISIRHFIEYIKILFKRKQKAIKSDFKQEIFNAYVCETLKIVTENTAKYSGGGYIKIKYTDLLSKIDQTQNKEPPKNADEIIANTLAKAGLKIKK